MKKPVLIASALTICASACAGTDAGSENGEAAPSDLVQAEEQPIDKGDGTFALPESWLENVSGRSASLPDAVSVLG
jgi:hypothetical protein